MNAGVRAWLEDYDREVFRAGQLKFCLNAALWKALRGLWRAQDLGDEGWEEVELMQLGEWCDAVSLAVIQAVCEVAEMQELPENAYVPPGRVVDDADWDSRPAARAVSNCDGMNVMATPGSEGLMYSPQTHPTTSFPQHVVVVSVFIT